MPHQREVNIPCIFTILLRTIFRPTQVKASRGKQRITIWTTNGFKTNEPFIYWIEKVNSRDFFICRKTFQWLYVLEDCCFRQSIYLLHIVHKWMVLKSLSWIGLPLTGTKLGFRLKNYCTCEKLDVFHQFLWSVCAPTILLWFQTGNADSRVSSNVVPL